MNKKQTIVLKNLGSLRSANVFCEKIDKAVKSHFPDCFLSIEKVDEGAFHVQLTGYFEQEIPIWLLYEPNGD